MSGELKPNLNQIIFIDLDYKDDWDNLEKGRPCLITEIKESNNYFWLRLLIITSQDEPQIKEKQKPFVKQYRIRRLCDCLRIDPSFVRIHRQVELTIAKNKITKSLCDKCLGGCFKKYTNSKGELIDEYVFFVKKHEDYRIDKLNASKLLPPIEVEIEK